MRYKLLYFPSFYPLVLLLVSSLNFRVQLEGEAWVYRCGEIVKGVVDYLLSSQSMRTGGKQLYYLSVIFRHRHLLFVRVFDIVFWKTIHSYLVFWDGRALEAFRLRNIYRDFVFPFSGIV